MYIFLGNLKSISILLNKVEYNLFNHFKQKHNGNVVVHTTYGQVL